MGNLENFDDQVSIILCRICLLDANTGINLFTNNEASKKIIDTISKCFQIILKYEQYLPSLICNTCVRELESANNFRLKCVTFEERFLSSNEVNKEDIIEESDVNDDATEIGDLNKSTDISNCSQAQTQKDLTRIHKTHDKGFQCEICNKTLKSELSFIRHNVSKHQNRKDTSKITGTGLNRRYNCPKCPYSTPHSQTLVNHIRKHNGERPYHCNCGKSFTQSASLAAHQKIHSNLMSYTCSVCGKQFKHAFSLRNHLRVHDTAKFPCNICNKYLKSQQSLKAHMNRHYNIRNYNCEDCGDTFVTSADLLNHKKKHTTKQEAECHLCGYKTHAKKNLTLHLKRHTGDKAYKCDICKKAEYTLSDLRRHRRVHSREKPYPCPACSQRFSHSGSLNQHAKNVHGLTYCWGESKSSQHKISTVKIENS